MVDELMMRADALLDKLLDHNLQFDAQTGAAQIVDDLMSELQTLREERTAWRVTAENAEAAAKQARIDALEEARSLVRKHVMHGGDADILSSAIESLKGTP